MGMSSNFKHWQEYDDEKPVRVDFHLKHPITGETVIHEEDYEYYSESHAVFMWTEGNWRCDCNRSPYLEWPDDDDDDGSDVIDSSEECTYTIELLKMVEHGTDRVIWPEGVTE